jgi:hypothetical protein
MLSVFVDADVVFAGVATPSEHSASRVVLRMGEITLLDCATSAQAIAEAERNLASKAPAALAQFHLVVSRSLQVLPNPTPDELLAYRGMADGKDLPHLVAAITHGCRYLLIFNVRDYYPDPALIAVRRPGEFVTIMRALLEGAVDDSIADPPGS